MQGNGLRERGRGPDVTLVEPDARQIHVDQESRGERSGEAGRERPLDVFREADPGVGIRRRPGEPVGQPEGGGRGLP